MRRNIISRLFVALALTAALGGCSALDDVIPLPPAGQALVIGLGYEAAKVKVEQRLGITCNPLNVISDGTYCVSNYKTTDRQEVWCFKTLGGVDCYAEPDPYSLAGRSLPADPRPLADPRMPMTPPHHKPSQVAVAPIGSETAETGPAETADQ